MPSVLKNLAGVDWFGIRKVFTAQSDFIAMLKARTDQDIQTVAINIAQKALVGLTDSVKEATTFQILNQGIKNVAVWEWDEKRYDPKTAFAVINMIEDKLKEEGVSPKRGFSDAGHMSVLVGLDQLKEKCGAK